MPEAVCAPSGNDRSHYPTPVAQQGSCEEADWKKRTGAREEHGQWAHVGKLTPAAAAAFLACERDDGARAINVRSLADRHP
jgi:hypothetical protein